MIQREDLNYLTPQAIISSPADGPVVFPNSRNPQKYAFLTPLTSCRFRHRHLHGTGQTRVMQDYDHDAVHNEKRKLPSQLPPPPRLSLMSNRNP